MLPLSPTIPTPLSTVPWSAFVEAHASVMFCPAMIAVGAAVKEAVGAGIDPLPVPPPLPLLTPVPPPQLAIAIVRPKRIADDVTLLHSLRLAKSLTIAKGPLPRPIMLFARITVRNIPSWASAPVKMQDCATFESRGSNYQACMEAVLHARISWKASFRFSATMSLLRRESRSGQSGMAYVTINRSCLTYLAS